LTEADLEHYGTFGFVVLRAAFDPGPLAEEGVATGRRR
jgi:hypothetical protein